MDECTVDECTTVIAVSFNRSEQRFFGHAGSILRMVPHVDRFPGFYDRTVAELVAQIKIDSSVIIHFCIITFRMLLMDLKLTTA